MSQNIKKVLTVLAFACVAMIIMALVTPLAMRIGNKWHALIGAVITMCLAAPICFAAEFQRPKRDLKLLWLLCYLMNSAANGLSVAAFYLHGKHAVSADALLQGLLPAMCVMVVAAMLLIGFPGRKKLALWTGGVLAAALAVMSFVPAVWPIQPQRSAMLFGALIAGLYLFVVGKTIGHENRFTLRDIAIGSFGVLGIITLVVFVILSDGEALEGLEYTDFGIGESTSAKKERNIL